MSQSILRTTAATVAVAATAVFGALPAAAAPVFFVANLSGPDESPPNASPGIGWAGVTFDIVAHTMTVEVTFSGLLGTVTASHIHCCTLPTAGVATQTPTFTGFPSGVTAGSYDHTFDMTDAASFRAGYITANGGTAAAAEAALYAGMLAGNAYLNIHTTRFAGGEIRGFPQVPEPATLALALGAVGLLGATRRRTHQPS